MKYRSMTRCHVNGEYWSVLVAATLNFEGTEQGKGDVKGRGKMR